MPDECLALKPVAELARNAVLPLLAMRGTIVALVLASACGDSKEKALEELRKQAEADRANAPKPQTKTITVPVPNEAKLPCTQVINVEAYQTALTEKDPLTLVDVTSKKGDAAADCNLVRGGKRLSDAEQAKLLKEKGRLGVLAGDMVCNVRLLCYSFVTPEKFKERCAEKKERADNSMGTFACVQTVISGIYDMEVYRFLDDDTKCVIEVRGGPSNTDNESVRACAKVARDTIGPPQIAVGAAPPPKPEPTKGSGS